MNDVQKCILSIFKEFQKVCNSNDIPYYAIGGTCIGAIRHKGFIPWDDDLDVAIPIEHFSRFLDVAEKQLPNFLKLYTCCEVKHYRHIFIKIIDIRTTFIEEIEYEYPDMYKGVFIDVMPISGVPSNAICELLFRFKQSYYYLLNNTVRYPIEYVLKGNNKSKRIWKYVYLYSAIIGKNRHFNYYTGKWMEMLKKHPFYTSKKTGYVWHSVLRGLIFKTEWFDLPQKIEFEDTYILCPKNSDSYLTAQFGNYMQLPPEKERINAHPGIIKLDVPYEEYIPKTWG